MYVYIHIYIYTYGFLVCRYARSLGLAARQNTPAIDDAIYRPNSPSYQLQPSFHTSSTEPTGGPRVIDVFDGNGAPSGPNYLLFSDVDRPADSLWARSGVG